MIDYMMEKHHERIRELAKLPMVGMRFAGIILRWEQNHEEPPPAEPVANSTYVAIIPHPVSPLT